MHQFSLRRLLAAVTVVALVLALAISFPMAVAELVTVNLLLIAPSAIVFMVAMRLSKNRPRTTIVLITGMFLGWVIAPQVLVNWSRPPTFWDEFILDFHTIGIFMFGGSIVATVLDFFVTLAIHNKNRVPKNAG